MRLHLLTFSLVFLGFACGTTTPTPTTCSPSTCLGCCDANGICNPGSLASACGFGGALCTTCSSGLVCSNGACINGSTGGGGGAMTGGGGGSMTGGGGGAMTGGGGGAMTGGGGGAMTGGGGGAMTGGGGGAMTGGGGGAMTGGGGGAMTGGGGGAMTGGGGGAMTGGGGGTSGTGASCASPLILPIGATVSGSTSGVSNFVIQSTPSNACRSSTTSADLVYQVAVPANSTVVVTATAAWDMVLNAVAAPVTNCGTLVGGITQGITCGAASDGTSGIEAVALQNTSAMPATWFLIVDGYATTDYGAFQISAQVVTRPMGPTEIEPNDTRVLADATNQLLTSGNAMNAELAVSEADLFRIDVPTAGVLRLDVSSFTCNDFVSVKLALLNASATELSSEIGTGRMACRQLVAQVQPGTYYVSLSRTATGTSPVTYWLTPTLLTARSTESEPNDTTNQANLMTGVDTVMCGALGMTTDFTDTFLFTLAQPATVNAEIIEASTMSQTCESFALDSRLELLSGAGLSVRSDTASGRGSCSRLEWQVGAGTWFLRVTEQSSTKSGFPYCLVLRLR
ncbi:MAG: hypothetical protein ACOZQL_40485 [Myxococcota bacterium]